MFWYLCVNLVLYVVFAQCQISCDFSCRVKRLTLLGKWRKKLKKTELSELVSETLTLNLNCSAFY